MTINTIFSFTNRPERQRNLFVVTPMNKFTPEQFLENCFGKTWANDKYYKDLAKISMWVTQIRDTEVISGWFLNRNGKFYFQDGVLLENNN